ncbi:hypothetical protein [Planctobacterium marinum]|uniref:hypothetical protein n=1 Tax=Planctobacterium marinum TaxID=1631968 RepID=UPI001E5265DB|nr:hypothetical protein [Planctobacterium marinum]MCC2607532.1 hypothetical protein [Planctobacterium marinum]
MTEIVVIITILSLWALIIQGPSETVKKLICCFLLSVVATRIVTQATTSLVNRMQAKRYQEE